MNHHVMTKNELVNIISPFIHSSYSNFLSNLKNLTYNIQIEDIEWKIENSNSKKVLFYHLNNNQTSLDDFYLRLNKLSKTSDYGLLIINHVDNLQKSKLSTNSDIDNNIIVVEEKFFLQLQKIFLNVWYPLNLNSQNKRLVGITGTNGKTTSVFLCQQISLLANIKAAALGTLGVCEDGKNWTTISSGLTTPPLIELQKTLHHIFHVNNNQVCFMEVSSHAIATERIYGLEFDLVGFTNFTQDHLDFHKDMNEYFLTKCNLAKKYLKKEGVLIVARDQADLINKIEAQKIFYSEEKREQLLLARSLDFHLNQEIISSLPTFLKTDFNQSNLELALDINYYLNKLNILNKGISTTATQLNQLTQLKQLIPAAGRFVVCNFGGKTQIIDFAHSPDAIIKIAKTAKEIFPNKRMVILFGCGGDRDSSKRPLMGEACSQYADEIYVTSDNPRFEDPQKIINDILPGINKNIKHTVIIDREEATIEAYLNTTCDDVLLLLGKGHEEYLDIKGVKYNYSDFNTLKQAEVEEYLLTLSTSLSTDTRTIKANEVFVALDGENYRGIDFIEQALQKNASYIIFDEQKGSYNINSSKNDHKKFIKVNNTLTFLQKLAQKYAKKWLAQNPKRKIIGITGTNGKTTHKEMLFHLLNALAPGKVYATEKNFNNHIGVPKTLLKLNDSYDIAIIEMGTNHPGEIKLLAEISSPNAGIITNIGDGHLEFFGSRENVFLEKRALFDQVMLQTDDQGLFVLKASDPLLCKLSSPDTHSNGTHSNLIFYYEESEKSYTDHSAIKCKFDNVKSSLDIKIDADTTYTIKNSNLIGKHNFENLAATFLLARAIYPDADADSDSHHIKELLNACSTYAPKEHRSQWIIYKNTKHIFMDAYNANPSSMKSSIQGFCDHLENILNINYTTSFFILGDMNELGESAPALHKEIGAFLKVKGIKNIAFIGRYCDYYMEGFSGVAYALKSKDDFIKTHWPQILENFTYFFIKGSRSIKLESLLIL
ncbi:MAG: UDP-N-acetylmuramyl-tripeptide synthetase [Oligoflexia bacterium]|nr:UDP-N-acetylmuramyl-tripeptide synthetase [Oligoflexia bacterium]